MASSQLLVFKVHTVDKCVVRKRRVRGREGELGRGRVVQDRTDSYRRVLGEGSQGKTKD